MSHGLSDQLKSAGRGCWPLSCARGSHASSSPRGRSRGQDVSQLAPSCSCSPPTTPPMQGDLVSSLGLGLPICSMGATILTLLARLTRAGVTAGPTCLQTPQEPLPGQLHPGGSPGSPGCPWSGSSNVSGQGLSEGLCGACQARGLTPVQLFVVKSHCFL